MVSLPFAVTSALALLLGALGGSMCYLAGFTQHRALAIADPLPRPTEHNLAASGTTAAENAHIYFLLDRSGSMSSIASDVIGGFNAFVSEQRGITSDARLHMTLIQFDTENPHEVLLAGREIGDVPLLTASMFRPRGSTPLFDALGRMISLAESAQVAGERVVVVTFSDGLENASREHSRKSIFASIESKRHSGWTFVFLGANQDSYTEGGGLGFSTQNTQNFKFDGRGTESAFAAVSGAVKNMRSKLSESAQSYGSAQSYDSEDFFEGVKVAEADYLARKN